MDRQITFADIEHDARRRATKKDEFLEAMDQALPWDALAAIVKPCYYGGCGAAGL